jgi:hypothetical protein
LPVPARADQGEVLAAADPFQRGEVVERRSRDRGDRDVELLERLRDGEPRGLAPVGDVGGVPGGDLGLDEGPQELFGAPTLGAGGDE